MLISSSKNFAFSHYHIPLNFTLRSDKVSRQQAKIHIDNSVRKSLKDRVCYIQKELIELSDNENLFNFLSQAHIIFFHKSNCLPDYRSFRCSDSAFAIIQRNLFNHELFREINSLENFHLELKDNEEGAFLVNMIGEKFIDDSSGKKAIFQGHCFIINKIVVENLTSYIVAQSFVEKYSLKSFILKNEMIYDGYEQLYEKLLNPLCI